MVGGDHVLNVKPRFRDDHIRHHQDAADFARWAERRWRKKNLIGGDGV